MTLSESIPSGTVNTPEITPDERQLAARNHGFLMEALRYPITPVGLHYLLIHYDVPDVEPSAWRLHVGGRVERPVELSLDEVLALPAVTRRVTFECAGNGRTVLLPRALSQPWGLEAVGTAEWTGIALWPLLEEAGLHDDAAEIVFTGLDSGVENGIEQSYARSLTVGEARRDEALLAHTMNGRPLPPQHGFPLRLVVPGWYGMANVKWLRSITAVAAAFDGYQQARAYRFRRDPDDPGTPLTRMRPRALMLPPGVPDFLTRERLVRPGRLTLEGRAWSGTAPISRVAITTDGGLTWSDAELEMHPDRHAWTRWTRDWDAAVGEYLLGCRAEDSEGNIQPEVPEWNLGGYACNSVHYLKVKVSDD